MGAAVNETVVRGDTLIVGTGKGVALLDAATGQRRGEVDATGYLGAVSPDGRTAYLSTDRAGQFVKLDLSGRRIVNTVQLDGLGPRSGSRQTAHRRTSASSRRYRSPSSTSVRTA